MRTTLKHSLATVAALAALALSGTACTAGDDPLGNPAATHLLALGRVTIAGAQTAPANTRALSQDPAGFIGIRKTEFKKGDALALTLTDGKGGTTPVTATLDASGTWTMDRTYYAAGTTLSATYTPAAGKQPGGLTHSDDLTLAAPVDLKADGNPLALTLVHANALLEVTPPAVDIAGSYTITLNTTPGGSTPEVLATIREEDAPGTIRYRTIALPGTVHSVTLTANNVAYTAPLNTPNGVKIDANKRYPIALTLVKDVLTATIATTGMDWGTGDTGTGNPAGYTRYIGTPEELAQFAKDVNGAKSEALGAIVMQTADIDLSKLTAAKDPANSDKNYDYAATADNWEPIGVSGRPFQGKYNGNGFSISNLTINKTNPAGNIAYLGLFGDVYNAYITGVHIKDCKIAASGGDIYVGALVGATAGLNIKPKDVTIALCSATGSITVNSSQVVYAGGMIGQIKNESNKKTYITRCRANVAVTAAGTYAYVSGFTGVSRKTTYMGCIASGKVTNNSTNADGHASGFSWGAYNDNNSNYSAFNCITTSELVNGNRITSAFGKAEILWSCLATQPAYGNFRTSVTSVTNNATLCATTLNGATSVTPGGAFATLTEGIDRYTSEFKTLHWSKETGYTIDLVENRWNTKDAWIDIPGDLPILDMAYEGEP